jgi:formate C-acetyltransferase
MRDRMFAAMTPEWKEAHAAGIFTEFMEQRSPGPTVLGDVIYRKGLLQLEAEVGASLARLDFFGDPEAYEKQQELEAMKAAADAVMRSAGRRAELAKRMAAAESDPAQKSELEKIAAVCRRVPAQAPRTFWEALQAYWFIHLSVMTEQNMWDSFSPGHLDQHLFRFLERDLASGELTRESARELLECFWVKFNNQPAPPKAGVTAAESGTYTDFCNLNTGGMNSDGSSAVNRLTYMVLDVIDEMRLWQPSSNLQLSKKNPDPGCRLKRGGFPIRRRLPACLTCPSPDSARCCTGRRA